MTSKINLKKFKFKFYCIYKLPDKELDSTSLRKFLRTGADKDRTEKKYSCTYRIKGI